MKKQIFKTLILSCITINSFSQIKIMQNGNVAIGINFPNYPLHVYGWAQLFNDNGMEIKFRPNNGGQSDLGSSNTGLINIWNANCWANGHWGTLKLGNNYTISDQRLKKNIEPLTSNLSMIKRLNPKRYNMIDSIETEESNRKHYGFLSQDVVAFLPDLIDSTRNVYALNYTGIIPFLVGAVKEQALTIDSLRAAIQNTNGARATNATNDITSLTQQLEELKTKLNYFENNCCATINTGNSNLIENKNGLNTNIGNSTTDDLLLQNYPNPFENTTTIKFNIPNKYNGTFYVKVFKISGEELMSYKVQRQDKDLLINASNLVNGVYNYALIANNEILQMKQMIISR